MENTPPANIAHAMIQTANGEFGIYKSEAEKLGPEAFAAKYGHSVWLWGRPDPVYKCVRHEGTDYLWNLSDGAFDGWDGINLEPRETR